MGKIVGTIIRDGTKYWSSFYLLSSQKPNVGCADFHCPQIWPLATLWAPDGLWAVSACVQTYHGHTYKSTGRPSNVNDARYVLVLFLKTTTKRLESVQLEEWVRTHVACLLRWSQWAELSGYKRQFEHMFVYSDCSSGRSYLAASVSSNSGLFTPFV